jgi:hypothetical protein
MAKRAATSKGQHGGPRPNSGRRTRYPNKVRETLSLWLTEEGRSILADTMKRNRASMMDVFEFLIREHGGTAILPPLPPRKGRGSSQ